MLFSYLRVTIHAQGQAPTHRHSDRYSRKNFTLPAPPTNQTQPIQPETLGTSSSLAAAEPRAGAGRKTTEVKNLFTISKTKANGHRPLAEIPE